jgi:hypothetical protein
VERVVKMHTDGVVTCYLGSEEGRSCHDWPELRGHSSSLTLKMDMHQVVESSRRNSRVVCLVSARSGLDSELYCGIQVAKGSERTGSSSRAANRTRSSRCLLSFERRSPPFPSCTLDRHVEPPFYSAKWPKHQGFPNEGSFAHCELR